MNLFGMLFNMRMSNALFKIPGFPTQPLKWKSRFRAYRRPGVTAFWIARKF